MGNNIDELPSWKPNRITVSKFSNYPLKEKYKALRNSSSSFIKKATVREIVMKKGNSRCALCGSINSLQIDHIISVYMCAQGEIPISKLNHITNLRLLCASCNSRRAPNEKM